jgi:hypothetical protein
LGLFCLRSRGPPGGPRRPREGPRIALEGFPGAPGPPRAQVKNLKTHTFCRALLSGISVGFRSGALHNRPSGHPRPAGVPIVRLSYEESDRHPDRKPDLRPGSTMADHRVRINMTVQRHARHLGAAASYADNSAVRRHALCAVAACMREAAAHGTPARESWCRGTIDAGMWRCECRNTSHGIDSGGIIVWVPEGSLAGIGWRHEVALEFVCGGSFRASRPGLRRCF